MADLSELQIEMLKVGRFHIDGWTSARGHEAAADLLHRGLVTCYESGSDASQYTASNFDISMTGRAELARRGEN